MLGVSRGENFHGIQGAFRDLAKRYDPDRAGPAGTKKFQYIHEAYEIRSDPEKRKSYNYELEQKRASLTSERESISFRPSSRPEALVAEKMSVLHDFRTFRPSFESLFARFVRNFTREGIPKGERLESLNVEVIVSPDEAAKGGAISMGIPVFYDCPQCGGSGRDWLFPCINCNAQGIIEGIIEGEKTVKVPVPPMVRDRTIIELPIQGLGIHNFYLCLHIRISR
jgi:DnaJ-class molecular chaperone